MQALYFNHKPTFNDSISPEQVAQVALKKRPTQMPGYNHNLHDLDEPLKQDFISHMKDISEKNSQHAAEIIYGLRLLAQRYEENSQSLLKQIESHRHNDKETFKKDQLRNTLLSFCVPLIAIMLVYGIYKSNLLQNQL